MGLPARLLGADEYVVIHTRTHAKALIGPVFVLLVIAGAAGVGMALLPPNTQPVGSVVIGALALLFVGWLVVLPWLRWWTATYTITNRRLITRRGILNKTGTDLPLNRIHEVTIDRSLTDRILGCGTLQVTTAADESTVVLSDVPDAEFVHTQISQQLFGTDPNARRRA